jgi:ESCRT-II complex subunit VPS25
MDLANYPPLYTLQPNLDVRRRQFEIWRQILSESKQFILDVSSKLFNNSKIERKINSAFFAALGDFLAKENAAVWLSADKSRLLFLPLTLDAYGDALLTWAEKTGARDTVETLFHIQQSSAGFEFDGAPDELVIAALRKLETRGKCKVLKEGQGVRFSL